MLKKIYRTSKNYLGAIAFYTGNHIIANIPFYIIRHLYYRIILKIKIGSSSSIAMNVFFTGHYLIIGSNTVINRKCFIDSRAIIEIGNNVNISSEVAILSYEHDVQNKDFRLLPKKVIIQDNVFIGVRATILPGVIVGEGAVIGAGAVVKKNIEPYTIVAGVPAKPIGIRNRDISYTTRYFPFFDTDISKDDKWIM